MSSKESIVCPKVLRICFAYNLNMQTQIRRFDMLDDKGFDIWANNYDKSVGICEDSTSILLQAIRMF